MELPSSSDHDPSLWVTPRVGYPAGLPSPSWIPAHKWMPPRRDELLEHDQRRAYRWLRRPLRAGSTLAAGRPSPGNQAYRDAFEGWRMAHQIARALRISPWDALDEELARTNGRVVALDSSIGEATSTQDLVGQGRLAAHVRDQRWEREHLVKTSKM